MIDLQTFRQTMGLFPGAVTLITTGQGDLRRGITATAVCSVSDTPPSLLVCVNRKTGTCKEIARSGRFSVQLLGQDHADVAMAFAGAKGQSGEEKFTVGDWGACPNGQPRLSDALASISCEVITATEAGSHMVFIGRMEDVAFADGEALIYARSGFHRLAEVA
ncbi:flavin reductase family protein [Thalassovita mangrovi]|uniref:Flavin reductase n=1 Tax=Thalassovita mangrovi TaxID=2692236 RepID=A0A6L8LSC1_9RHOB|nr:flavin reductase family protein [Thalassovita mangrovi]MYM57530.1 flavin reductase [Thalassovita mangrovi]